MSVSTKNEALFWKKKEVTSFILSILVFLIHISSFAQYPSGDSAISQVNMRVAYFLKESITKFAVPMFYILSGISFFKDYDNKKYPQKIKSRVFTLFIPYVLWNTLWMVFELICSNSVISHFFVGRQPFDLTFTNVLKGIFFYTCNGPFWYVFNLIIFAIASPLIYEIIRNRYVGMVSIILLCILSLFGIHLPTAVFFSPNSIIYYMIGGLIGRHYFDFAAQKSNRGLQIGSVLFFVIYICAKNIFSPERHITNSAVEVVVFTLCSFAVWNIVDLFIDRIKPRPVFSRSFAIYAMHVNVSAIITKIVLLCLPRSEWFAIPNFMITFILTVLVINLACVFMEKYLPKVYSIFMGNRLKPKK